MIASSTPKVVNTHWFGGVNQLPSNTIYIGRPSIHGNAYSSKSGKYIREECVALHRIDLYRSLILDSSYFAKLKQDLIGKDLACWCKNPKRLISCHGDNFLHIFQDRLKDRMYDKTILHYLMDDLRFVMSQLEEWIKSSVTQKDYLDLFVHFADVRLDIQYVLIFCREKYVDPEDLLFFIATLVINLELAKADSDLAMINYRFDHTSWQVQRFITNRPDRAFEPLPPHIPNLRKPKGKSNGA